MAAHPPSPVVGLPFLSPATSNATLSPACNASPFIASAHAADGKAHLLLACTGSVATIKLSNILAALSPYASHLSVRLLLTAHARHFLAGQSTEQPDYRSLPSHYAGLVAGVHVDEDEWIAPWTRGAPILHIELRRWADALVVAPLSANALAKLVHGFCDDLLGCVLRAWDVTGPGWRGQRKRVLLAPAMNTAMWLHPVTAGQIKVLEEDWGWTGEEGKGWVQLLRPTEKELACGDVGVGAMREWTDIVAAVKDLLGLERHGLPEKHSDEAP